MRCENCRRSLKVGEWVKLTERGAWCMECVRRVVKAAGG